MSIIKNIVLSLILGMVLLTIPCFCFQAEYYLYTSTYESNSVPVLKILSSGQIVTTGYVYSADGLTTLGLLSNQNKLIVSNAPWGGFWIYTINPDYSLTLFSTASGGTGYFYFNLSPNEQVLLGSTPDGGEIWSIDTMGHLTNTGNTFNGDFSNPIRPQGDITIAADFATGYMPVYHIDYNTKTLTSTQNISFNNVQRIVFSPDGNCAIGIGHNLNNTFGSNSKEVALFSISPTGTVSTTTSMLGFGLYPLDGVISPDGQYLFMESPSTILTLRINSNSTTIQDTGNNFYPPSGGNFVSGTVSKLKMTPDGKMIVFYYDSYIAGQGWLGTAWVNGNGSLTWTGYVFPYDATFGGGFDFLNDMVIVPNYITAVPKELWEGMEER